MAVSWRNPMTGGLALVAVAALLWSGAAAGLLHTVQVTDDGIGITRACGSAFDALSGRSGWETWWARDLDEAAQEIRIRQIRTSLCPEAVNRSIAGATSLAGAGGLAAFFAWMLLRRPPGHRPPSVSRLVRLGRLVGLGGGALTVAGVAGTIALVADPDATVFLYTSRPVVAAAALLLCLPALALAAGGRALVVLAEILAAREASDDA